jgi:hypothetical protein
MHVVYVGPHRPGVDVGHMESGVWFGSVERGVPVDLPDDMASGLLAQGDDHWQPAKPPKKKE